MNTIRRCSQCFVVFSLKGGSTSQVVLPVIEMPCFLIIKSDPVHIIIRATHRRCSTIFILLRIYSSAVIRQNRFKLTVFVIIDQIDVIPLRIIIVNTITIIGIRFLSINDFEGRSLFIFIHMRPVQRQAIIQLCRQIKAALSPLSICPVIFRLRENFGCIVKFIFKIASKISGIPFTGHSHLITGIIITIFCGNRCTRFSAMLRNDVYDTTHSFRTIKYRIRTLDHFDLFYRIDRNAFC